MKKCFRNFVYASGMAIFSLATAGCIPLLVGAAAGAGGFAYVQGALQNNFDQPVVKVYDASKKALGKLKLPVKTSQDDVHNAKITSEYADGKNVTIDIEAITEKTSRVKIRVGVFGDRMRSEAILAAINRYL